MSPFPVSPKSAGNPHTTSEARRVGVAVGVSGTPRVESVRVLVHACIFSSLLFPVLSALPAGRPGNSIREQARLARPARPGRETATVSPATTEKQTRKERRNEDASGRQAAEKLVLRGRGCDRMDAESTAEALKKLNTGISCVVAPAALLDRVSSQCLSSLLSLSASPCSRPSVHRDDECVRRGDVCGESAWSGVFGRTQSHSRTASTCSRLR